MELHGVHRIICANRQMMDELVYNLCDNAIRYNNPGGRVDITVDAAVAFDKTAETGATIIEVKDTGIGISKEHQESVYLNAFTAWIKAVLNLGGTGLGLAIVKAYCGCPQERIPVAYKRTGKRNLYPCGF